MNTAPARLKLRGAGVDGAAMFKFARSAAIGALAVLVLLATAVTTVHLRRVQHERSRTSELVGRIRVGALRSESLGWQALSQNGPNFSIQSDLARLRASIARDANSLRRLAPDDPSVVRIARLLSVFHQGVATEQRALTRGRVEAARSTLTTVLLSTSDLLEVELDAAAGRADRDARSEADRAAYGSVGALSIAAGLICALLLAVRRGRRAALVRSEHRFRSLVQNASEIVVVVDPDSTITYVTEAAVARLLGWDAGSLIGRPLTEQVELQDRNRLLSALSRRAAGHPGPETSELAVRHRDGRIMQLEAIGADLRDEPSVGGIVLTLRDVTERRAMEEQLRHQAFHDVVTGLANRALLEDRVQHALRRARRGGMQPAVLFVDLDDFKAVNDSLGHAAGDALLVQVAKRLCEVLRASDTAARFGGDEFALLVEDAPDDATVVAVAERLAMRLADPVSIGGRSVTIRASIGVARAAGVGTSAEDLLRDADIAMYAAKVAGGDRYELFRGEMLTAARERLELREDLRLALERGELSMHYQPVVGLAAGRADGVEALMRWEHPEQGPISPARFIPVAEETGLIVPIGAWALERACRDLSRFREVAPELRVWVNVSVVQLREPGFAADVSRTLIAAGVYPGCLVLELTESALIEDAVVEHALAELRGLGVAISVDDFGTGYSSLSYLQRLEVDSVKIDRSLTESIDERPRDAALIRSIVELGHTLDLGIVAEGIERESQLELLLDTGCDLAQGYLFARPAPADVVAATLVVPPWAAALSVTSARSRVPRSPGWAVYPPLQVQGATTRGST